MNIHPVGVGGGGKRECRPKEESFGFWRRRFDTRSVVAMMNRLPFLPFLFIDFCTTGFVTNRRSEGTFNVHKLLRFRWLVVSNVNWTTVRECKRSVQKLIYNWRIRIPFVRDKWYSSWVFVQFTYEYFILFYVPLSSNKYFVRHCGNKSIFFKAWYTTSGYFIKEYTKRRKPLLNCIPSR